MVEWKGASLLDGRAKIIHRPACDGKEPVTRMSAPRLRSRERLSNGCVVVIIDRGGYDMCLVPLKEESTFLAARGQQATHRIIKIIPCSVTMAGRWGEEKALFRCVCHRLASNECWKRLFCPTGSQSSPSSLMRISMFFVVCYGAGIPWMHIPPVISEKCGIHFNLRALTQKNTQRMRT